MKKKMMGFMMAAILAAGCITGCASTDQGGEGQAAVQQEEQGEFASFSGKDFEGKDVDASILKKNKITVLNFWFNGCSACVSEMPDLEKFNEKLKEKNAELIGVNVDAGGGDKVIEEAKEILKKQGATYKNMVITEGEKTKQYMEGLLAFPTTILVDENGKIIGEQICGSLNEEMMQDILNQIDQVQQEK